ncbi:MAG: hypothetical protein GDYSWBUE_001765 [Candidatus Fervidibacterota bacterium]
MTNAPEEREGKAPYAEPPAHHCEMHDEPREESPKEVKSEQQVEGEKQYEPVAFLPLSKLSVLNAVNFILDLLIEYAWQKMGLVANPITGKIERDIEEARFAIDTIAVLLEHIKPKLDGRKYDQLRQTLTTLRINFVEQASKGESES